MLILAMGDDDKYKRSPLVANFGTVVALVIGGALVLLVITSIIVAKYTGIHDGSEVTFSNKSVIAFFVVFLSYGFVAIFLVMLFTYRILSPFSRLITEMQAIVAGDLSKRLFLRGRDVYLIKNFVTDVNTVVDNLQTMHTLKDDLIKQIDSEGQQIISMLNNHPTLDEETKNAVFLYHEKVTTIVKGTEESAVTPPDLGTKSDT
ncbi:methyl-accepting chemotaxis protein [Candidatus Magnetomonas plexicatena]|uniref:methyl-accepting chemotaxis protein n=1 Tax=Candidatus Magnetomonas plexicatena TaxID=2552947 RepID=UPI001C763ED8|nr:methyl-accepting chemotaxis protein [Nitrospirales bacterium LBB_01]